MRQLFNRFLSEAGAGEGGGQPTTPVVPREEAWKLDPRLDENGNPKPVQPIVEQTKTEDTESTDTLEEEVPTETHEDPVNGDPAKFDFKAPIVKQVESLLVEAGLKTADVVTGVTASGGKVPAEVLKALVDKHGAAYASLIANQLEGFYTANKVQSESRDNSLYNHVQESFKGMTEQGGKETWAELKTWAATNVDKSERDTLNKMLSRGGYEATLAIDTLVAKFKNSRSTDQSAELLQGSRVPQPTGVSPISKSEYSRELRVLLDKGHVYGESSEIGKLDARRAAGIKRGI